MAELPQKFLELMAMMIGKEESVVKRTFLVTNTSDVSVAARESGIQTDIKISEYFRVVGYDLSMMACNESG